MMENPVKNIWRRIKQRLFVSGAVSIGERFHIGMLSYVWASRQLIIGDDVYIGKFCSIQCNGSIGNAVLIANNVGVVGRRDHDIRQLGVPIRRSSWIGSSSNLQNDPRNTIHIGDDVWLGYGAVVLTGITIGRGAIVSAGAVVARDVAPYDIVAGNPAVTIGRRFDQIQVLEHEQRLKQTQAG